ncbi:hypothetical protein [Metabacillus endolithicus]|uniref:hypothetical protein n=1 Tax=Metabacillus endolithicus TaxID=1535204 RepID=UPI00366C2684
MLFLLLIVGKHIKNKKKLIQTYTFQNFIDTEHATHHPEKNDESIVEKINEFFDTKEKNDNDDIDSDDMVDEE